RHSPHTPPPRCSHSRRTQGLRARKHSRCPRPHQWKSFWPQRRRGTAQHEGHHACLPHKGPRPEEKLESVNPLVAFTKIDSPAQTPPATIQKFASAESPPNRTRSAPARP